MMPFSVFRTWGLGLISWAILGLGIYLLWEYADRRLARDDFARDGAGQVERPPSQPVPGDPDTGQARPRLTRERAAGLPAEHRDWPYLAGGVALLLLSVGGFMPVLALLGKPKLD